MATENEPEKTTVVNAPQVVGGVEVYTSSEEFQRAHADGIAKQREEEQRRNATTDRQKIVTVLDKLIAKHNSPKAIRERIKENNQAVSEHTLEVQFEVSDILAKELEKIKNELR